MEDLRELAGRLVATDRRIPLDLLAQEGLGALAGMTLVELLGAELQRAAVLAGLEERIPVVGLELALVQDVGHDPVAEEPSLDEAHPDDAAGPRVDPDEAAELAALGQGRGLLELGPADGGPEYVMGEERPPGQELGRLDSRAEEPALDSFTDQRISTCAPARFRCTTR